MKWQLKKSSLWRLLIELALCSLAGFLAPYSWFFDLFNHFRPHAILAGLILLITAAFIDIRASVAALLIIALNTAPIYMRLQETSGVSDNIQNAAANVKIISSNVLSSNTNYQAILQLAHDENPDILVLTEPSFEWDKALEPLEKNYPYSIRRPNSDNFGVSIYAKRPFKADTIYTGALELPILIADFDNFRLIAAHPIPPLSPDRALDNHIYIEKIAELVRQSTLPVIVAGDLNSTLWSSSIKPLITVGMKRINPAGIAYTWPTNFFPFAIQIDHFFAKGIDRAKFSVLSNIGSDHFPIQTVVEIP